MLLVFAVNQVAGAVPFTPGGAGVQQALLVKVFAKNAPDDRRRRLLRRPADRDRRVHRTVGLGAVVFIFRFRSFKEVISAGRASREAERAEKRAARQLRGRRTRDEPEPPRHRRVRRRPRALSRRAPGPRESRATEDPRAPRARA